MEDTNNILAGKSLQKEIEAGGKSENFGNK